MGSFNTVSPIKSLNGDDSQTITKDYISVIKSIEMAINAISNADSLYNGRNAKDANHSKELREFKSENISILIDLKNSYMESFREYKK